MKNKYFKSRNGSLYLKYTKKEIIEIIENDNSKIIFFLKEMNYPYIKSIWKYCPFIGKYIARMNLRAFKNFEYKDSEHFNED